VSLPFGLTVPDNVVKELVVWSAPSVVALGAPAELAVELFVSASLSASFVCALPELDGAVTFDEGELEVGLLLDALFPLDEAPPPLVGVVTDAAEETGQPRSLSELSCALASESAFSSAVTVASAPRSVAAPLELLSAFAFERALSSTATFCSPLCTVASSVESVAGVVPAGRLTV
jgi:hypothetical protein